ncbi:hypothetical protein [Microcella sp.]|uniref:hypothetical protein n=1 Tax=Microcella sp. TaxID=1913979 RepID=UPI003F7165AB
MSSIVRHDERTHLLIEATVANLAVGGVEFRGGWLASNSPDVVAPASWQRRSVGPLSVAVHPSRDHAIVSDATASVLVIGWTVDTVARSWDQERAARTMHALLRDHGWDALIRYVAYLAGRFLVVAALGDSVRLVPDAVATISAYTGRLDGQTWFGSHATLVAEQIDAQPDLGLRDFLAEARKGSNYVVFRPGVRGDYREVRQLLPNHYWELLPGREVSHTRFYPFSDTVLDEPLGGVERFSMHFDRHIEAICSLPNVTVSLTGGNDSGSSFAGFRRHRREDTFTWTIADPGTRSQVQDAEAAGHRSRAAGVPHRVVPKEYSHDPEFERAARRTFAAGLQAFGFSSSTFSGLPHDIVNVQSMLAEVGTGFYRNRDFEKPTASNLARTYSSQPHGASGYAREAFAEFIEYADFREERFGPWSWYDILYWESRAGLWSAIRVAELELSHRVEMPYNSRHVLEALASGSWRQRQERVAQKAYSLRL